jgi:two-component system response regulator
MKMVGYSIIMVDDDEEDFILVKEAFDNKKLDHKIKHVNNGQELIEYLSAMKSKKNKQPDLILLDINMPMMNGYETLNNIKKKKLSTGIPVMMYSTSGDDHEKNKCFKLGANAFACKSSTFEKLLLFAENLDDYLNHRGDQFKYIQINKTNE